MDYMYKVVRLYYLENMSQQEIADYLNISRAKVYRLLLKAREDGIVNIELRIPSQDYSELELEIEKKFNINQCVIVPASDSTDILYNSLGRALSLILNNYLKDNMKLGVGWGSTIRYTVEKLNLSKKNKIEVYPTIGGGGLIYNNIHANSIVNLIANKLNGIGYVLNCLAILDSTYSKEVLLKESYIEAIVKQFDKLDAAIVPIGYIGDDITLFKAKHISEDDLAFLKSLGVVGDINSNFIDINGNLVKNRIQDRILNVSLDSLRKIKNTIAICHGEKKIIPTKAALKSGVINTLIIDSKIGENLLSD
ncbi:MAG: sugar-binding domain-containing protein [Thermoanaerobacterales bacterium]|nr:sugar-binding domain-containing protein [Thermoanaerobacterales bacterium]